MPTTKDCPLCGGTMLINETQSTVHIPGNPTPTIRTVREWICPECDYYEELGEGEER